jgi:hypothetical protein
MRPAVYVAQPASDTHAIYLSIYLSIYLTIYLCTSARDTQRHTPLAKGLRTRASARDRKAKPPRGRSQQHSGTHRAARRHAAQRHASQRHGGTHRAARRHASRGTAARIARHGGTHLSGTHRAARRHASQRHASRGTAARISAARIARLESPHGPVHNTQPAAPRPRRPRIIGGGGGAPWLGTHTGYLIS